MMIATQVSKHHYLYPILDKDASFYHSHNENSNHYQHYHSQPSSSSPPHQLQNQESNTAAVERTWKDPFIKRILVVDDDPDITLTFKVGLEGYFDNDNNDKTRFEVYTYNNPAVALSEFKPNFYDILLVDVYMPDMNGFQFCEKILSLDVNVRVCFISAAELNIEALREVYPKVSFGCFMKKPVTIEYLVKRLLAELD
ncbi:MAG: PleD family two-component system response regulator [Nitrososphaeraceae archaeon]